MIHRGSILRTLIIFRLSPPRRGGLDSSRVKAEHWRQLAAAKKAHGLRVLVSVGGWGRSDGFSAMALSDTTRSHFIQALLDFCGEHDLDGADFDWEFPKNPEEKTAYEALLQECKATFSPQDLLVTVALNPNQHLSAATYRAVDRIHLMTYDQGVRHATFEYANNAARRFVDKGAPPKKIALGIPFYGRRMDNRDVAASYVELLNKHAPPPRADEAGGFYFNGPATVRRKTRHAQKIGLGGVMIWEIAQDSSDEHALLQAIHGAIGKGHRP